MWLIRKLGGYTKTYIHFGKDGSVMFSTDGENWTYGLKEGEK
jgi:hypothetical protein